MTVALTAPELHLAAQQFTSRTELVEVYATVTDRDGRLATDLRREEFQIAEDDLPQVAYTFAAGDQPVSLALAVDRSWSMAGPRLAAAQLAGRVLLNELGPQDKVMLIAISSQVDVPVPLTDNRLTVDTALQALDPWGSTALHDAVVTAFDAVEPAPGRRALVLLSDGIERHSAASAARVLARVRASDVMAYPIVLQRPISTLFAQLGAVTGGRTQRVGSLDELPRLLRRIASELRHQYLIGYQPARPGRPGDIRRITVRVTRPGYAVRARAGYVVR